MSGAYTLNDYVTDLRQITREAESEDEIITRVGPLAQRLALDKTWLQQKHYEANPEQGFGTFLLHCRGVAHRRMTMEPGRWFLASKVWRKTLTTVE
jgi:hypothetical protein